MNSYSIMIITSNQPGYIIKKQLKHCFLTYNASQFLLFHWICFLCKLIVKLKQYILLKCLETLLSHALVD